MENKDGEVQEENERREQRLLEGLNLRSLGKMIKFIEKEKRGGKLYSRRRIESILTEDRRREEKKAKGFMGISRRFLGKETKYRKEQTNN